MEKEAAASTMAGKIIVALDVEKEKEAYELVNQLYPLLSYYKVGLRLFVACGPRIIATLKEKGCRIFLDLKLHDIPHTVAATAKVITSLGVDMFNIHLSGGGAMVRAAAEAAKDTAQKLGLGSPKLIGVTVLTSISERVLQEEIGVKASLQEHVVNLSLLGKENGLSGVVASPQEAEIIGKTCGDDFLIVTPGIRPQWSAPGDQQRILTPRRALEAGAHYLVIGRPILQHPSPREAAEKIIAEMMGGQ